MYIHHNSHLIHFRSPFGAVPTESKIKLSLEIDCQSEIYSALIRLWNGSEQLIEMTESKTDGSKHIYSATVSAPEKPCLLWYYFIVNSSEGTFYYSNNERRLGGIGVMTDYPTDISYQITVFDKDFRTPDWFKNSIMYQIFPDRFYASEQGTDLSAKKTPYTMHKDWYEPIYFDRHPFENGPACNDFYGGNFKGICEKIPYLKALGISVLYLNPIFEAFSNHRYDTADYSNTDPILGSEEDFEELCRKCEENGIKIILDGVFSHTGSDSVYFNKYGHYGENEGAFRNFESPYRKWYQWIGDGSYESWWGCSNLPNIHETEPTYIDYILSGDNAIIKKWLKKGAFGWRLDVADELPDSFIKTLREQVKKVNPDAVVIGEVWEDASNKVSYSIPREYLLGHELDSVMNYPFKDSIIGFLLGYISAEDFGNYIMSITENYPFESLYCAMNMLGTHDTMRIKTVLGELSVPENAQAEQKQSARLSCFDETKALNRLLLAIFWQMTFMGVPCIYYGDEIGMQGLGDPFNRMPFTWRCVDTELLEFCRQMTALRNSTACLRTGCYRQIYAGNGVFAYLRYICDNKDALGKPSENQSVLCIINRNNFPCIISLSDTVLSGQKIINIFNKEEIYAENGTFSVELPSYGYMGFSL